MADPKPVDLVALEHFRLESTEGTARIVERGTVITGVEAELAIILAGAGKARLATLQELAEARTPKPAK